MIIEALRHFLLNCRNILQTVCESSLSDLGFLLHYTRKFTIFQVIFTIICDILQIISAFNSRGNPSTQVEIRKKETLKYATFH